MASHVSFTALMAVCLLCATLGADAACCTMGQPTYTGNAVNFAGLPTCSDGPCSGKGFDYRGAGASESPNPESCCDTDTGFYYNPQATEKGATWPPIDGFPTQYAGTGRQCSLKAPLYKCSLGGQELSLLTVQPPYMGIPK
ncbi:hypothetical protein COO60DRAFT_1463818 [Scenedesmus sp. NREL 46B-D3]|nr:hypothetical protein COO60DRAFT_1463818 [Scenedesmus sp. NREL 46B-D3]